MLDTPENDTKVPLNESAAIQVHFNLIPSSVTRWSKEKSTSQETAMLAVEEPLALEIDGKNSAILMRLPGAEKELAIGFCISEGIIERFSDISMVHHCGSFASGNRSKETADLETRNKVRILTNGNKAQGSDDQKLLLVRSGCGRNSLASMDNALPRCTSSLKVTTETLGQMNSQLFGQQKIKRISGGLHSAVLYDKNAQMLIGFEDVGRHNAMDKILGHAYMRGISLENKILFTTGRSSYEMVTKAARTSIPILVSLSAPTSLAVELAQACAITLIGYSRSNKMVIYSCPERIDFDAPMHPLCESDDTMTQALSA